MIPLRFSATRERLSATCADCKVMREFDRAQAIAAREELAAEGWRSAGRQGSRVAVCGACARPVTAARATRAAARRDGTAWAEGDPAWMTGDAVAYLLRRETRRGDERWRAAARSLLDERRARRVAA
jgi:hypothetical protein